MYFHKKHHTRQAIYYTYLSDDISVDRCVCSWGPEGQTRRIRLGTIYEASEETSEIMYNFRDFPHIIWRVLLTVEKMFAQADFLYVSVKGQ